MDGEDFHAAYLRNIVKEDIVTDKAETIEQAFLALLLNKAQEAKEVIQHDYPFVLSPKTSRRYAFLEMLRVFRRDGFIDRYAGTRLVFPGTLRILSKYLPEEFPFHPNWKMTVTHQAYWELLPTIDHVVPVARGGEDMESNWITTSQLRNSAKANWTLEELGWTVWPVGNLAQWDGLMSVFCQMMQQDATLQSDPYLKRWYQAAQRFGEQ